MAQSARFSLSLRVLVVLATKPEQRHTSGAIAEQLGESAVMVRRAFLLLQQAGLIAQRKGPQGGALLKVPVKEIGLGDVYTACSPGWLAGEDEALTVMMKRVKADAVKAMNETNVAQVLKRMKKSA